MPNRGWTRDELILAMNLYCRLPFGKPHARTSEIIELAGAIQRTPSSLAMKLVNLASLDPAHAARGVRGLLGASNADRSIWKEFHENLNDLVELSERLRTQYQLQEPEKPVEEDINQFVGETEASRTVAVRLAQRFFRRTVLAGFDAKCCVSGIACSDLLVASHIVPWAKSPEHRVNPQNGLCLSRIHDGAFDKGLVTFDEEFRLVLSRELKEHCENKVLNSCFRAFESKPITLRSRFRPDRELLQFHRQNQFRG